MIVYNQKTINRNQNRSANRIVFQIPFKTKNPFFRRHLCGGVRVRTHIILNNFPHLFTSTSATIQQYNGVYFIQLALIFHYILCVVYLFLWLFSPLKEIVNINENKLHMTLAFQIYSNFISIDYHDRDSHFND